MKSKLEVRKEKLSLVIDNKSSKDKKIVNKLNNLLRLFNQKNILSYMPMKNEVDISAINDSKEFNIYIPKILSKFYIEMYKYDKYKLKKHKFGMYEPDNNQKFSEDEAIIIMPVVAFDINLHRLGYGGGYYDRFLKDKKYIKIGLAYQEQVSEFEYFDYDIRLDYIITDKKTYSL